MYDTVSISLLFSLKLAKLLYVLFPFFTVCNNVFLCKVHGLCILPVL